MYTSGFASTTASAESCGHALSASAATFSTLESQCIIYQNYMDSAFVTGISCNQELAAYCIRGFAVEAFAGFFAWSFDIESLGIGWGCYISGTFHCCVKVGTDFVHSHDEYYFGPWAIQETRLEFPSMLTMTPSLVIAFALERNTSASYAAIRLSLGDILLRSR